MKVLLKSLNYFPELTGIGKYNSDMCEVFVAKGFHVTAVVAPPYYPEWKIKKGYKKFWYSGEIINGVNVVRCPLVVPTNVTTKSRLLHLLSFAITSAFGLLAKLVQKPDFIILIQPTLFCAPCTLLFAKLRGVKVVLHVQDYELDALLGLGMLNEGLHARFARVFEKWLMLRFDAVSSISYSMLENACLKGVDERKAIYFPNWADTEFVTPESSGDKLKSSWGFNEKDKIILYAGNIGNKQGLEIVLAAAEGFRMQKHIKFLFVGTGSYVKTLKRITKEKKLDNVYFKPLQPWVNVPALLAMGDIHLVIQKKGAADAVMPSKLTNILSAGGFAIVTAEDDTELGKIANIFPTIYHCIEPENIESLTQAIIKILENGRLHYNKVARDFALKKLNKESIIDKYIEDLKRVLELKKNL